MEPSLDERKNAMNDFLREIDDRVRQEASKEALKHTRSYKMNVLTEKKNEARENCTSAVLCKLYRNSLPVSDEYRCAYQTDLDNGFMQFIQDKNKNGMYAYIVDSAESGSVPAKTLMEFVNDYVNDYYQKFYENLEEIDADEADLDVNKPDVDEALNKISTKMDFDEVSKIIEDNVKETVQAEAEQKKAEDDVLTKIQEELAQNEEAVTESAIDAEFLKRGIKRKVYQPTLFGGIMINKNTKVQDYAESAVLDMEHQQKEAFFESVKEYTAWELVTVLDMERMSENRVSKLARDYAYMKR